MSPHPLDATLAALSPATLGARGDGLGATIEASSVLPLQPVPPGTLEKLPPALDELPAITLQETTEGSGDLRVVRMLGEGGMGRVVLAHQRSLRRRVAVKTAHAGAERSAAIVHEGVVTGLLEHPNIPPIHSLSRDAEGRAVLVMKHIEGVTWAEVLGDPEHPLRAQSPLFSSDDLRPHLEVLLQLCNALELAHAQGVIHRDIKPENVLLGRFGEVYLIDWGVAFPTSWHADDDATELPLVGTPLYMAPEMVLRQRPDPRTDVYLLGATLHEVLVGAPPHAADSLREALVHAYESAAPTYGPDVPAELAELCRRALARDPDDRPASAREFREALRAHLSHRASITLCAEALARLDELRALLTEASPDPVKVAAVQSALQFGFHQALREWPGNDAARSGLSAACRVLAAHELALGNPRGARALVAEIPEGDAELTAAVEALERQLRRRAEAERLRLEQEREMDMRVGQRERVVMLGAVSALVIGLTVWFWRRPVVSGDLVRAHRLMIEIWAGMATLVAALLVFYRRRMLGNVANRRWVTLLLVIVAVVGGNRAVGMVLLPGAPITLTADLLLLGTVVVAGSLSLGRELMWGAVPCVLATLGVVLLPDHAGPVFNVGCICMMALVAIAMRRAGRSSSAAREERAHGAAGGAP